ncbi:MAG TPA: hypothetical protein VGD10_12415 [Allosphingosinicella sp.]|uniref:hypothetical protein n=1 Tax=Allosphingosinicella sp. TaxID=2823234 RepID=UPI002ED86FA5
MPIQIFAAAALGFAVLAAGQAETQGQAETRHRCEAAKWADLGLAPHEFAYQRAVQSDSLWLKKHLLARYPDRVAAIYHEPIDGNRMRLRMVVRMKGHDPLPPMKLKDRAARVPVVVQYGAPHSLEDVHAIRRRVDHTLTASLLPTLNGTAYSEYDRAMRLDVYAADEGMKVAALAKCEELEKLYGMPVKMEFHAGRITLMESGPTPANKPSER